MSGTLSSRRPDRPNARHSPRSPGRCCRVPAGSSPASSLGAPPPGSRGFSRGPRGRAPSTRPGARRRRPRGSGARARSPPSATTDPGGVGARHRVGDLGLDHLRHAVRHGPHALADLRLALEAAFEVDIDVPILVGLNPRGAFHVRLADHRARFHRGMNFVAGAVQEAGVDENDAVLCGADAFFQINGGAALLVHDAHLQGQRRQVERLFNSGKQRRGAATSSGPCIFGFTI